MQLKASNVQPSLRQLRINPYKEKQDHLLYKRTTV